jgi:hypothetical protein
MRGIIPQYYEKAVKYNRLFAIEEGKMSVIDVL